MSGALLPGSAQARRCAWWCLHRWFTWFHVASIDGENLSYPDLVKLTEVMRTMPVHQDDNGRDLLFTCRCEIFLL